MSKESQAANQASENEATGSKTKPLANGFVSKELIPNGFKQVAPIPPYFLYRGYDYKFSDLKKEDLERILSYRKNPWFVKEEA